MSKVQPMGSKRAGATAVEMAVVMIPFFLFVFALFEFGRYTMLRNLVVNAAREAARLAVVNTDVSDSGANRSTADIQARAREALAGQSLTNFQVRVFRADAAGTEISETASWEQAATYQKYVAVEITGDYAPMFPLYRFLSPNGSQYVPVLGKAVMRSEGN